MESDIPDIWFYGLMCNFTKLVLLSPELFHSFELPFTWMFEKCVHKDK